MERKERKKSFELYQPRSCKKFSPFHSYVPCSEQQKTHCFLAHQLPPEQQEQEPQSVEQHPSLPHEEQLQGSLAFWARVKSILSMLFRWVVWVLG